MSALHAADVMVLALSIRRICLNDSFYSVFKVPSPSPFRKLENESQIGSGAHSLMAESGGGDEGARTPDLLLAKQALSQLSYIPWMIKWAILDSNQRPSPYQRDALTS